MAKKPEVEESELAAGPDDSAVMQAAEAAGLVINPRPFELPPPQNPPPTEAQLEWMRSHPAYVRISHALLGRFTLRGTLTPDGAFVSDTKSPVIDGGGCFGVGIPVPR